jgi:hypothetical protein
VHFRLEAGPEELREKGTALVQALAGALFPAHSELAEQLEKALPRPEPSLKYPVLRELHERTAAAYRKQLDAMLREIGEVLDEAASGVTKSLPVDHTKAIAERDAVAYERIKQVLRRKGYSDADFEEGGRLYGESVNELVARARREGAT